MSFPTTPAFIHTGGWSAETRAHPAMAWMESYMDTVVDKNDFSEETFAKYATSDFHLQKPDGQTLEGNAAWEAVKTMYSPFKGGFRHEPGFFSVWEANQGWEMFGQATFFYSLTGEGEKLAEDNQGKGWEGAVPGAFHFAYVKEGGDIKMKSARMFLNELPAAVAMVKLGWIKL